MIPLARSSVPTRNLIDYWNDARLRVAHAKSASVRPAPGIVPWRAALEDILKVGYGLQTHSRFVAGAWERVRWRTTPSAGALYPFEIIACILGEGCYLWEVEESRLVPYGPPLSREELAAAGFVTTPGHRPEALLFVVARPWLSMQKYRMRGYAYCHLDVGHVTTNLAMYMTALGLAPTLHLRFSHTYLAEHLRLDGLCREPLAALSFASAEPAAERVLVPVLEPGVVRLPTGLEPPEPREILNWESLLGILSLDSVLEPPSPPARVPLVREPGETREGSHLPLPADPLPLSAAQWRSVILGRRSAKGFRVAPLGLAQIGELLGALRAESLRSDCSAAGSARLGVRLVARNVDGLAGVFSYDPRSHALHRVDDQAGDPRPACMQQEIAGGSAALVIFHAPICRLVDYHGYSAFAELHFHAAELGQRLHLAASRLGDVGITCLGGFDSEECAALARLADDDEAIYVILLGVPDEGAVKEDRLNVAWSHGYATREG